MRYKTSLLVICSMTLILELNKSALSRALYYKLKQLICILKFQGNEKGQGIIHHCSHSHKKHHHNPAGGISQPGPEVHSIVFHSPTERNTQVRLIKSRKAPAGFMSLRTLRSENTETLREFNRKDDVLWPVFISGSICLNLSTYTFVTLLQPPPLLCNLFL